MKGSPRIFEDLRGSLRISAEICGSRADLRGSPRISMCRSPRISADLPKISAELRRSPRISADLSADLRGSLVSSWELPKLPKDIKRQCRDNEAGADLRGSPQISQRSPRISCELLGAPEAPKRQCRDNVATMRRVGRLRCVEDAPKSAA